MNYTAKLSAQGETIHVVLTDKSPSYVAQWVNNYEMLGWTVEIEEEK